MAEPASGPKASATQASGPVSVPPFDELYAKLEETTRKLEEGNLGLEASISLYEDGAELVAKLRGILAGADLRIRKVQARLTDDPAEPPAVADAPTEYDTEFEYVEED